MRVIGEIFSKNASNPYVKTLKQNSELKRLKLPALLT